MLTWWLIKRGPLPSTWLRVEIPAQAVIGRNFPVTVVLHDGPADQLLGVDLHWRNSREEFRGTLSGSVPQRTSGGQRAYTFNLSLPARDGLAYIYGVIYVSPTGRWNDRTRACTFEPVAVTASLDPRKSQLRRQAVAHDLNLQLALKRRDSEVVRWGSVALLAIAGLICARLLHRERANESGPVAEVPTRWGWLALACLLVALWEATTAESVVGNMLRHFAIGHGWYEQRRFFQELLTTAVIVASTGVATAALRRARVQPASLVFCAADVYWRVSAVSFISLHDADAWLATPVLGLPVVQLVKLVLAVTAVTTTGAVLGIATAARA